MTFRSLFPVKTGHFGVSATMNLKEQISFLPDLETSESDIEELEIATYIVCSTNRLMLF